MNITLLQSILHWHEPQCNRESFEAQISAIEGETDLILLPEMFTTGFTNSTQDMAEDMDGPTVDWMKEQAKTTGAVLCGSLIIRDVGGFYNRMVWVQPDGHVEYYDKRHLFGMGGEGEQFTAGREQKIVEYKGLRFCLQVCYDLRFPVWSRNRCEKGVYDYDCLLYVANWPSPRANAWRDLLRARAIENLSYSVGLNRVGEDDKGLEYPGDSVILDFKGLDVARGGGGPEILTGSISKVALEEFRKKFPVGMDADDFVLRR